MSHDAPAERRREIHFGAALAAAFACVFAGIRRFAKAALLPFAASLALAVLAIPVVLTLPLLDLAFIVIELLPYAVLGVALNRALLLGQEPRLLPRPVLGARTWRYFGYTVLVIVVVAVPVMILVMIAFAVSFAVDGEGSGSELHLWPLAPALVGGLALLYVAARLGLIFPAIAVDQRWGLGDAWRATRGKQGLKLFVIFFVLCILLGIVGGIASALTGQEVRVGTGVSLVVPPGEGDALDLGTIVLASLPGVIVSTVIAYLGFGLVTGAYAYAFSRLSGWGGRREDILERFE